MKKWLSKWDWGAIMFLIAPIVIAGIALWSILGLLGIIEFHTGLAIVIGLLGLVCVPLGFMISMNQYKTF